MKKLLFALIVTLTLSAEEPKVLFEGDPALLVTDVQVVVLTGSSSDPIDKVGLSNMVGELLLRGTKKRSRAKFQAELEKMGAVLGVRTLQDLIIFDGKVIKENTDQFLSLLEDCLLHPSFSKAEFESLKTELLAEASHIKNVNNRLGGVTARKEMFAGTSLATPVNGSLSTLSKIQLDDLVRAYNNLFHRGNVIFGAASSLPEGDLKSRFTKIWLNFPDGARLQKKSIAPKLPESPKLIVVHKPKTSTGALIFAQGGITAQEPLRYALNVGNFSFGAEPLVSRLFRTIRGELGWTYAIGTTYAATGPLSYQQGMFLISSTPSVEFTTKTILKTLQMWKQYYAEGLDGEELKLARESMINSYPFEFDSAEKRVGQRLSSYIYGVPILSQEEFEKTINSIGKKEIRKALQDRQKTDSWWIVLVADKDVFAKQLEQEQKEIPAEKRLTIHKVITPDDVIH